MGMIKNILVDELQDMVAKSAFYKERMQNAKTAAKKQFYFKKLTKNNNAVLNALYAIDRVEKKDEPSNIES